MENKKVKDKKSRLPKRSGVFYTSLLTFWLLHIHTAINLNDLSADIA